jgi:hypothetical protein
MSTLTVSGTDAGGGYLVQNWNATYRQNVTMICEIGSDSVYWLKGRPVGEGSIARMAGPASGLLFGNNAFKICDGGVDATLKAYYGCDGNSVAASVKLSGLVVTTVGTTMNAPQVGAAQGATLTENFGFMFSGMEIS